MTKRLKNHICSPSEWHFWQPIEQPSTRKGRGGPCSRRAQTEELRQQSLSDVFLSDVSEELSSTKTESKDRIIRNPTPRIFRFSDMLNGKHKSCVYSNAPRTRPTCKQFYQFHKHPCCPKLTGAKRKEWGNDPIHNCL